MKALRSIVVLTLVLVVEVVLSLMFISRAVNLAKYPFRREERYAALEAWEADRSPEKGAAYREELRLASRHHSHVQLGNAGIIFTAFLVVDGVFIYTRWRGRERQQPG